MERRQWYLIEDQQSALTLSQNVNIPIASHSYTRLNSKPCKQQQVFTMGLSTAEIVYFYAVFPSSTKLFTNNLDFIVHIMHMHCRSSSPFFSADLKSKLLIVNSESFKLYGKHLLSQDSLHPRMHWIFKSMNLEDASLAYAERFETTNLVHSCKQTERSSFNGECNSRSECITFQVQQNYWQLTAKQFFNYICNFIQNVIVLCCSSAFKCEIVTRFTSHDCLIKLK